jgi:large subunit ribosomal protein L18
MKKEKQKSLRRARRHRRVRGKVFGTPQRPRLSIYRSLKNIYSQLVDDTKGITLAACSTLSPEVRKEVGYGGNIKAAEKVGQTIARIALGKDIKKIVFDRGPYKYHGRVKALAEAARKEGLEF